ncbi:MAG: hypothetical protein LBK76_06125 [Verrucomicrobiales bacterium]|nr:hypothetical protein [Verrucomicrobiales bacterium]
MNLRHFLRAVSVLSVAVIVSGCGGGSADLAYNCYLTEETPLLEKGPYQQEPPLRMLSPGTRVRIISGGATFVQVATVSEEIGWVPLAALRMQSSSDDYRGNTRPAKNYPGW